MLLAMTKTKAPPPPQSLRQAHKHAPACGCFGFTQADLEKPRHEEIDAQTFARCYSESYLITSKSNLKRRGPA